MIKLLLTLLLEYIDNNLKHIRRGNDTNMITIYEVTNKDNVVFTRIDIFTKVDEHV